MDDKSHYARLFGVSERDIVPEYLPILKALESNSKANKELIDKLTLGSTEMNEVKNALIEEFSSKLKGSIKTEQHYYYDELSAFWGHAAKFAFPSLAVIVISILLYWYASEERESKQMYQDAERIIILSEKLRDEKPKIYKEYILEQAINDYNNSKEEKK